jgi:hypothetical protein
MADPLEKAAEDEAGGFGELKLLENVGDVNDPESISFGSMLSQAPLPPTPL